MKNKLSHVINFFKRTRTEINKGNQLQGKAGENLVKTEYQLAGWKMDRTGKGHDFRATRRNWVTGKKETKYVEVKTGKSPLSPLQKKKKKKLGSKFVEERVNTDFLPISGEMINGLSNIGSNVLNFGNNDFSIENPFVLREDRKPKKRKSKKTVTKKRKKRKKKSNQDIFSNTDIFDWGI